MLRNVVKFCVGKIRDILANSVECWIRYCIHTFLYQQEAEGELTVQHNPPNSD